MSMLFTRTLAALAFERGEEFEPALTLPSAPLTEDLALLAGARDLMCALSPMERRRRRERGACAAASSALSLGGLAADGQLPAPRTR